jgi:hypothetical protein
MVQAVRPRPFTADVRVNVTDSPCRICNWPVGGTLQRHCLTTSRWTVATIEFLKLHLKSYCRNWTWWTFYWRVCGMMHNISVNIPPSTTISLYWPTTFKLNIGGVFIQPRGNIQASRKTSQYSRINSIHNRNINWSESLLEEHPTISRVHKINYIIIETP